MTTTLPRSYFTCFWSARTSHRFSELSSPIRTGESTSKYNITDRPHLSQRIDLKINYKNPRNKGSFLINNVKAKYVFSSPDNTLTSAGNNCNLDLFYCLVNTVI